MPSPQDLCPGAPPSGQQDHTQREVELPAPGPVRPAAAPSSVVGFLDFAFPKTPTFRYVERGAMASMGSAGGVVDNTRSELSTVAPSLTGRAALAVWKGAYLSKQVSYANMLLIPMYWFKTFLFGRDISRF